MKQDLGTQKRGGGRGKRRRSGKKRPSCVVDEKGPWWACGNVTVQANVKRELGGAVEEKQFKGRDYLGPKKKNEIGGRPNQHPIKAATSQGAKWVANDQERKPLFALQGRLRGTVGAIGSVKR